MLNNKGQSLIMFVMVIPIFLIILILVLDIGRMILVRRELDNINYITLDYVIDNNDNILLNDKIKEIVLRNDQEIDVSEIKIEENKVYLELKKEYQGYFLGLINKKLIDIKSSYVGYKIDEKKYIERVK